VPARGRRVAGASRDLERRLGGLDGHGERRRRVALDGPDDVPGRRQYLGSVPQARPVSALAAPGDARVEVDDALVERRGRGRGRAWLGPRRRDGAVGRLRQGAPRALGLGHPRVLLRRAPAADLARTRSDPRAGGERPHRDPRQAVRIRGDPQRRAARRRSGDDRGRRSADGDHAAVTRRTLLVGAVAVAVAVAFADSSIVVLALPELYARFDTTIEGVAWVITSYNLVLAICALALVLVVHHARANLLLATGTLLFLAASIACALADSIGLLIAARSVQGLGGALLLAGSLPVLGALGGSTARGVAIWTLAGTFGAAVGPALGGVLTQLFDWRAIFVFQAPVAGASLLATFGAHVAAILREGWRPSLWRTVPGNVALALLSGALVGTLFLGVLLVIDVFGLTPIQGAAVVSAIPAATLLARPLAAALPA